jgi:NADH-quinone oxidoreductase subunit J
VNLDVALHQVQFNRHWLVALLLTVVLGAQVILALTLSRGSLYTLPPAAVTALEPNTEQVAWSLFHTYMLPFELASILLLVAMIGAVVMSKKRV